MPNFLYTAKTAAGESKAGLQEAASETDLARLLRGQGMVLTSSHLQKASANQSFQKLADAFSGLFGVPLAEKMIFARHLAVMIGAGLSLSRALDILAVQTKNPKFSKAIKTVSDNVKGGATLADSLAKFPKIFSELFVNMVRIGEASGSLENVLKLLAGQMEKDHELLSKVKSAMVYPAVILAAMCGIGVLMMVMVVPKLADVFKDMDAELPAMTKFILGLSGFLSHNWIWGVIIVAVLALAGRYAFKTQAGKTGWDWTILRLPVFGDISRKVNSARLARTLGSLIESGVPIVQALQIISGIMGNTFFKQSLAESAASVQKGEKLSDSMKRYPSLYPPMVSQMMEVGEETGTMGEIMLKLAEFFEEEVNNVTKSLASIIEPLLMVIIGAAVGLFAISMIQPMYSLMENI